jgi:hypothetical protein
MIQAFLQPTPPKTLNHNACCHCILCSVYTPAVLLHPAS